jgi:hypothetical protein
VKFSEMKTVIIELTEEEATHLKNVIQKYRDGDQDHTYMTGNAEEDEFVNIFLGYINVEVRGA